MSKPTCETCRFWRRFTPADLAPFEVTDTEVSKDGAVFIGECRRYPPVIVELGLKHTLWYIEQRHQTVAAFDRPTVLLDASRWPVTWDEDGCGEWQEKTG